MRSLLQALLLAVTVASPLVLTKPIPMSDEDIQRRWSQGDSEANIHAASTYRDATPAWPVLGRSSGMDSAATSFTYASDERTMALHKQKRESPVTPNLLAQMKAFVRNWYKTKGKNVKVGKMEEAHSAKIAAEARMVERDGEAPVLKPKQGMVYHFSS